jgi:hypothetical protein
MLWKILIVTSTSPIHILDQGRTITAPIGYEDILKMEGASSLPLESTFKCRFRPDSVVVQITEPPAGTASCPGLKGGNPPLARRETAAGRVQQETTWNHWFKLYAGTSWYIGRHTLLKQSYTVASSSGILYTWTGSGNIVCTGMYQYVPVHTGTYQYRN